MVAELIDVAPPGPAGAGDGPAAASAWRGRPGAGRAALVVALVAAVSLAPVLGYDPHGPTGQALLTATAALAVLAAATGETGTARLGLSFVVTLAAFALPSQLRWWPLPGLAGVLTYLLVSYASRARGSLRALPEWLRGRLNASDLLVVGCVSAVTCLALLIYHGQVGAGFGFGVGLLNRFPTWTLPVAGLGFVVVNATVEEYLFRGVILEHVMPALGVWPAVVLQAVGFGLLNLHGYPYGPLGVALTTAYGLALGVLRIRTGGLLAGWLTHLCADGLIFAFIAHAAVQHV